MSNTTVSRTAVPNAPRRRRRRPPPGYQVVSEFASRAERAPSTIYDQIAKGNIRASRWRGLIIVADADADAYLSPQPLRPAGREGGAS